MFRNIQNMILRFLGASNPLDALIDEAVDEFESGKTTSLRDFAKDEGIDLS